MHSWQKVHPLFMFQFDQQGYFIHITIDDMDGHDNKKFLFSNLEQDELTYRKNDINIGPY